MPGLPLGCGELLLLKGSLAFWLYVYLLVQFSSASFWVLFCVGLVAVGSWLALVRHSLPRGDDMLVKEVLGVDPANSSDPNDFVLKTIAHRFAGLDAPENSMAALEAAHSAGANAVEFDVQLTSDRVAVVFHDGELDRLTTGTGAVGATTWGTLARLDVAVNHPFKDRFTGSRIPKFEDVVKRCLDLDIRMFIDIKDSSVEMVNTVCDMFDKYPVLFRRSVISSFNPLVIYRIRARKPAVVGCMAWRPNYFSCKTFTGSQPSQDKPETSNLPLFYLYRLWDTVFTWLLFNLVYKVVGISAILLHKDAFSWETVNWWRGRGVRCLVWTCNYQWEKTFFLKNNIPVLTDTMQGTPT